MNNDNFINDFCEAFDIKPSALFGILGGIFSLGGLIVSSWSQSYTEDERKKQLEEMVREEVRKANGRYYH